LSYVFGHVVARFEARLDFETASAYLSFILSLTGGMSHHAGDANIRLFEIDFEQRIPVTYPLYIPKINLI
jgi:hypothetical protein